MKEGEKSAYWLFRIRERAFTESQPQFQSFRREGEITQGERFEKN